MDKSLQNKPGTQGQILHDSNYMSSLSSVQFSSLAQSCPTFCNPMDCSTPGFPVLHYLPELAQTHVHWVDDAIHAQESSPTPQFKSINSLALSLLYCPALTSIHDYWKNDRFDYIGLGRWSISLPFNMLSRFFIAFLQKSKYLLISWLQWPSVVILEPKKIKSVTVSTVFPSICH